MNDQKQLELSDRVQLARICKLDGYDVDERWKRNEAEKRKMKKGNLQLRQRDDAKCVKHPVTQKDDYIARVFHMCL